MSKGNVKGTPKKKRIMFSLDAPESMEVFLSGDFNQWEPKSHPMKKNKKGVWEKAVMLVPGRHEYKFFVDGYWEKDPKNDLTCPNRFGTDNSVLIVS